MAGIVGVALGPEIGDQPVAAERAGMLDGQEGQQGDALPQGGPTGHRAVGAVEEALPSSRSVNIARTCGHDAGVSPA